MHIFGSESMVDVAQKYQMQTLSIQQLQILLFPEWYHSLTDVYLKSKIRALLLKETTVEAKHLLSSIREMMITFRFIEESGLPFDQTYARNNEEKLVVKIVEELKEDEFVTHHSPKKHLRNKGYLKEKLQPCRAIYFYGMELMSATAMRLVHALRSIGIKIIFRIPYENRFPAAYKGWQKIYHGLSRKEPKEWEVLQRPHHTKGTKFAGFLDGKKENMQDEASPAIMRFNLIEHFRTYFHERKDPYAWVAADRDKVNTVVTTAFNSKYENIYGKFIYFLQRCEKRNDELYLSYQTYEELITSAWVFDRNVSGVDSKALVKDLRGYMEGVKNIQEIIERLATLQELSEVSKVFDDEGAEKSGKNRVKRYLSNPFRVLPYVHRHRYQVTIKQLYELTVDLQKKLQYLVLNDTETMDANEYLKRFTSAIVRISRHWDEEQAAYYQSIYNIQLNESFECYQPELFDLLNLLLSDKQQETEPVQGFLQIPSFLFSKHRTLHVTDISLFSYPSVIPALPKWLKHSRLKEMITPDHKQKNTLLHCLLVDFLSRKYAPEISLYNLYSLVAFYEGNLEISWIKNLRENDLPSIYLEFLTEIYGESQSTLPAEDDNFEWREPIRHEKGGQEDLIPIKGEFPNLYWLDLDFCARKFFFTSIIEQQPIYETDFHQRLAFATISSLLEQQSGGRKEVEEALFPLFPQWTGALKLNLLTTEFPAKFRKYYEYDNVRYPKAMNRLQKLRSVYRENHRTKARNQYEDGRLNEKVLLNQFVQFIDQHQVEADNGHHCSMCPHLTICMEGMYPIDSSRI